VRQAIGPSSAIFMHRLYRRRMGNPPVMRQDNYPPAVSDPEAKGLPAYADDDSDAYERADSPRISDGPDPAPLPADRPLAVDRFGTTAEEQRAGESVDYKLAREEPEVQPPAGNDLEGIPPIQPNPDSPASMYDIPDESEPGRVVGGPTAEEAAIHVER
jgi:hypothetical protein